MVQDIPAQNDVEAAVPERKLLRIRAHKPASDEVASGPLDLGVGKIHADRLRRNRLHQFQIPPLATSDLQQTVGRSERNTTEEVSLRPGQVWIARLPVKSVRIRTREMFCLQLLKSAECIVVPLKPHLKSLRWKITHARIKITIL